MGGFCGIFFFAGITCSFVRLPLRDGPLERDD
jgi:hypothetical protein